VTKKSKGGEESIDFPSVNTADCNRSHLKNYLLHTYKVDLDDKLRFPDWGIWWKAYQGEVLKPRGKMQVNHGKFLPPAFMEGVMDMVGLAMAVFAARGTASYEELLKQLPEEYKDSYHKLIQMGAQYVTTIFLAQRSIESMVELDVGDLVWEESDTVKFSYFREKSRGASKNHYADIESCVDGGVIPNLYLTRGERAFNPAEVVQTYMSMRSSDEGDSKRLMMQAKQSVKYASHGCEPVIPSPKGQRFNLHDPEVKTCFMGGVNVMGKNLLRNLCPKLAEALRMPRVVNRDMRATAIQALRMAKFSTEEVCKISRHKQASTIERNYNIGLHSDQRADMAVAIAQAPLLKRGHEFQSVSEHLP